MTEIKKAKSVTIARIGYREYQVDIGGSIHNINNDVTIGEIEEFFNSLSIRPIYCQESPDFHWVEFQYIPGYNVVVMKHNPYHVQDEDGNVVKYLFDKVRVSTPVDLESLILKISRTELEVY